MPETSLSSLSVARVSAATVAGASVREARATPTFPIESRPPERGARSLALDMLRGVAILLVLGCHYVLLPQGSGPVQSFASAWRRIGWAGVDLFFVLSGFLVSGLLFTEYQRRRSVDVRRFIVRRGLKIWPAYFAYLLVVALWLGWQQHGNVPAVWAALWPNLFHVQNYFHTPRVHTWSLAVEEHFYLAVALLFLWGLHARRAERFLKYLPFALLTAIVGVGIGRWFSFRTEAAGEFQLYATHLRADGLLIGTLLAYATAFHSEKLARLRQFPRLLLLLGTLLAVPTLVLTPDASIWTATVGLTVMYAGFALIVLGAVEWEQRRARIFSSRPAAALGKIGFYSYSIYLWHVDLAQTPIKKLLHLTWTAHLPEPVLLVGGIGLYVAVATLVGSALSRLIEIPVLAIRDRWFPAR